MSWKTENPGALAGATGAECKAAGFTDSGYPISFAAATETMALRIAHLVHRANIDPGAAATLAGLIWEGAA